jgi:hypothetical protein
MTFRRGVLASVFTVALLLTACGGGDDKSKASPSATSDAGKTDTGSDSSASTKSTKAGNDCVLVGTDAITEAMGREMKLVLSYAEGCEWRATADSAVQVFVTKIPVDEYNVASADPVSGIGDEAFIRKGLATTTVYMLVGSDHFSVEAGDLNSADQYEDEMIAIAKSVAATVG